MLRPLQAQQLLLGGKMHTRSKACIAFRMLDDKPWHGEPPPVRRDGGDAFSHLSDDERDPKHWALSTQPNLGKLKQMVLAVKQIIGHFKGGKLDGKRWQLRHICTRSGISSSLARRRHRSSRICRCTNSMPTFIRARSWR